MSWPPLLDHELGYSGVSYCCNCCRGQSAWTPEVLSGSLEDPHQLRLPDKGPHL